MARLAKNNEADQQKALVEVVSLTEGGRSLQVAAAGMIPTLISLADEGADALKFHALRAIANICKEKDLASWVPVDRAIPLLVRFAQGEPDGDAQVGRLNLFVKGGR